MRATFEKESHQTSLPYRGSRKYPTGATSGTESPFSRSIFRTSSQYHFEDLRTAVAVGNDQRVAIKKRQPQGPERLTSRPRHCRRLNHTDVVWEYRLSSLLRQHNAAQDRVPREKANSETVHIPVFSRLEARSRQWLLFWQDIHFSFFYQISSVISRSWNTASSWNINTETWFRPISWYLGVVGEVGHPKVNFSNVTQVATRTGGSPSRTFSTAADKSGEVARPRISNKRKPRNRNEDSDDETSGRALTTHDREVDSDSAHPRLLACPYYKLDPIKHLNCFKRFHLRRVKDVKQHLNRKHSLTELHCPVCWRSFESQANRDNHVVEGACSTTNHPRTAVGIMTLDQQKAIAKREMGVEEATQWYNIWRILFPGKDQPESPYLGTELQEVFRTVRQYWRNHSHRIVSSVVASQGHARTSITDSNTTNASGNQDRGEENVRRFTAKDFTDAMEMLLKQLEEDAEPAVKDQETPRVSQHELPVVDAFRPEENDMPTPSFVVDLENVSGFFDDPEAYQYDGARMYGCNHASTTGNQLWDTGSLNCVGPHADRTAVDPNTFDEALMEMLGTGSLELNTLGDKGDSMQ